MPRGKQSELPTMEGSRRIPELHNTAMEYVDIRDRRMELLDEEVDLKAKLLDLMKKHKKDRYICDGVEIRIVTSEETVKVKLKKEKDQQADAA